MSGSDIYSAVNAKVITPSDSAVIGPTRAIYVGGQGDLTVRMVGGMNATFSACPVGTMLPIQVDQVRATLTTATNIMALW